MHVFFPGLYDARIDHTSFDVAISSVTFDAPFFTPQRLLTFFYSFSIVYGLLQDVDRGNSVFSRIETEKDECLPFRSILFRWRCHLFYRDVHIIWRRKVNRKGKLSLHFDSISRVEYDQVTLMTVRSVLIWGIIEAFWILDICELIILLFKDWNGIVPIRDTSPRTKTWFYLR